MRYRLTDKARLVPSMEKSLCSAKNSDVRPLLLIDEAMDEVPCVHYYKRTWELPWRVEHTKLVEF